MSTFPDASDCQVCDIARLKARAEASGDWWDAITGGMITCPTCGNKRCPKATFHGNECTGSNEPNQPGSSYQICKCDWGDEWWDDKPRRLNPACAVPDHAPITPKEDQ